MARKAIVCGGSIGGLFAAAALQRGGWQVEVFERVDVELAGRGAGIVTHAELIDALRAVGAGTDDLGVAVQDRVAFARDGGVVHVLPYPQIVTSWDRIHRLLRGLIADDAYHLGRALLRYEQGPDGVRATFADGHVAEADVLIGADGFRSAVRAQMLPKVQPGYAGYVVWRTLAQESDLPQTVLDNVFPHFGIYAPAGSQLIGYPIAGPENDLRPGHRRYNFVWYVPVPQADLDDMLTDASGQRHAISIPPPLVRDDVLARMQDVAQATLPPAFLDLLRLSERPFFTPIYDHHSPVMADGRVALSGDAACVARPHVGMGVTKAAEDALALARHLGPATESAAGSAKDSATDPATALAAYSAERVPASRAAHERARELGALIQHEPKGGNPDGRNNPNLDFIMKKTAVSRL